MAVLVYWENIIILITFYSEQKDGKSQYDFETVHNIDEYGADFTPTVRAGMRCWNMTVQFWLASNVYKRLTLARPIK